MSKRCIKCQHEYEVWSFVDDTNIERLCCQYCRGETSFDPYFTKNVRKECFTCKLWKTLYEYTQDSNIICGTCISNQRKDKFISRL